MILLYYAKLFALYVLWHVDLVSPRGNLKETKALTAISRLCFRLVVICHYEGLTYVNMSYIWKKLSRGECGGDWECEVSRSWQSIHCTTDMEESYMFTCARVFAGGMLPKLAWYPWPTRSSQISLSTTLPVRSHLRKRTTEILSVCHATTEKALWAQNHRMPLW